MINQHVYMPIIKSKTAELNALSGLDPELKERIIPLIEIIPAGWDAKKGIRVKPLSSHLSSLAHKIDMAWRKFFQFNSRQLLIDPFFLSIDDENINSFDPIRYLFTRLLNYGLKVVPVFRLEGKEHFQKLLIENASTLGNGVCFRIQKNDIEEFGEAIENFKI